MSNYSATVVTISNIRKHSNADRLACTTIFGNNIIVGSETMIGQVGLFFPVESQIGEEFAKGNDLLRRKDESGKPAGGMFDPSTRRVRCQQFRGEKSMGFWIPIQSLFFINDTADIDLYEGDQLETYMGKDIAKKYVPKQNPKSTHVKVGRKPRESKIIPGQFHFHFDTDQLGRNMHKIHPTDQIVLTWKKHGTSAIAGNCLVKKKLNWFEKLLRTVGVNIVDTQYEYLYASRRVVKNLDIDQKEHFYGEDLWTSVGRALFFGNLKQSETVYFEILGFTDAGGYIQKDYDYGCNPGINSRKIEVYRITRTSPDGTITELQWNQVKARCHELGVDHVVEIFYGDADITALPDVDLDKWRDQFLAFLQMKYVYDQDSIFCSNKVPEEGIVLRKEGLNIELFKLKSFKFLGRETEQNDKGEVDIETNETI